MWGVGCMKVWGGGGGDMGFMWEDGQKCHVYNLIFHKDANTESPKLVTKMCKD